MLLKQTHDLTPNDILKKIISNPASYQYSYIILGKSSPTGKTSLKYALKDHGFNAMEISEFVGDLVRYDDNDNHLIIDPLDKVVIIVLNKLLERRK